MNELIQSFVGKECAVACAGLYSYVGTIEEAKENWITLREKNGTAHLINLDYVYDVKEVKTGYECGLVLDGFNDIQELDIIEAYKMVEVPR